MASYESSIQKKKEEKKKQIHQRIAKLKLDVTQKNMLKMENKSLKEMQKLLMNRLEQQDEYFNQCMFGKQQEIDQLIKKIKAFESETQTLRESL